MQYRDDVARTLEAAGLTRARYFGRPGEPRWGFGWGISEADGQVTVWCNPGGPSREAWHRSAMLADRVDQCLTIAGFPTYRDRDRDPQQIIVTGPARPLDLSRHLSNRSAGVAALGTILAIASVAFNAPGLILAAALCLYAAIRLGLLSEGCTGRDRLPGRMKGSTP